MDRKEKQEFTLTVKGKFVPQMKEAIDKLQEALDAGRFMMLMSVFKPDSSGEADLFHSMITVDFPRSEMIDCCRKLESFARKEAHKLQVVQRNEVERNDWQ